MDPIFLLGLIGSFILVTGAAWPEIKKTDHPAKSLKNWMFVIGGLFMLIYAFLNWYNNGGSAIFVFLQIFIAICTFVMIINADEKTSAFPIGISGLGFVVWSLYLGEGYKIALFIIGLTIIGLGYICKTGTLRRFVLLTLGGIFIAIFSYISSSWIFFWLNVFFAIFSGYYVMKMLRQK